MHEAVGTPYGAELCWEKLCVRRGPMVVTDVPQLGRDRRE